jgi:hypothetical protein
MKPHYRVQQAVGVVKHSTLEEAQAEAERLAEKFSGVPFEILQCVGTTQTAKPQTFWMDPCLRDAPGDGWDVLRVQ